MKKTIAFLLIFILVMSVGIFYLEHTKGDELRQSNENKIETLKVTPYEDLNYFDKFEKWFYSLYS